jgi:hypothetical protein
MGEAVEIPEYPNNSLNSRIGSKPNKIVERDESRKVAKVITGGVTHKRKSLMGRFSEKLFGGDGDSIGSYIMWDILVPAAKTMIMDMITTALEMKFYGEPKRDSAIRRDKGRSYVSYNTISSSSRDRDRRPTRDRDRERPEKNRARHDFDDIILESRSDAEGVLSTLIDLIDKYELATVADFYDAVGLVPEWTDQKWGWDNLSQAFVERSRQGWILVLPKPDAIQG